MQVEKNIFAANSIAYTLNQPPLAFAGGVSFDFTGKGFIGGGGVGEVEGGGKTLVRTPPRARNRAELPAPPAPRAAMALAPRPPLPIPPPGRRRRGAHATRA